jgi:hypothetical protein
VVIDSKVTRYKSAAIADDPRWSGAKDGDITLADSDAIDRQTIHLNTWDNRGNSTDQTVIKESASYSAGVLTWNFSEATKITTLAANIDLHDRATHSTVKSYSDSSFADAKFLTMQDIAYTTYDRFGNVELETVDTYSSQTVIAANLIDHKKIQNNFLNSDGTDNPVARSMGNPRVSTVSRWTDTTESDTKWIDQTKPPPPLATHSRGLSTRLLRQRSIRQAHLL